MTSANPVVLGLDLSKNSTGYAIGSIESESRRLSITRWSQIQPHPAARAARWVWPVAQSIVARLQADIEHEPWFIARHFSVAIEANVFGESSTEFQYFLGQAVLRWVRDLGIDCVQYAPSTLKAYIRRFSEQELGPLGGDAGKVKIERVWRTELAPLCPDAFPSSLTVSNDAVDAGFITLLGLYAQAPYLPLGRISDRPGEALFWEHPDPLREPFLQGKLFTPSNIPAKAEIAKGTFANLKSNLHLSVAGKNFFPFRQLDALGIHLLRAYGDDPKGTLLWCAKRARGTAKANRDLLESGEFECALHSSGQVLITPV